MTEDCRLLIDRAFEYVIRTSKQYNIDESHALKHSMQVFGFAQRCLQKEVYKSPALAQHAPVIYVAALLHDMCDHKYVTDDAKAFEQLRAYLQGCMCMNEEQVNAICSIIDTMSYSKVKKHGFPDLGLYQHAYHIVREADLMAAYDPDRCIIYSMMMHQKTYSEAVQLCIALFEDRVLRYAEHGLLILEENQRMSLELHARALEEVDALRAFV